MDSALMESTRNQVRFFSFFFMVELFRPIRTFILREGRALSASDVHLFGTIIDNQYISGLEISHMMSVEINNNNMLYEAPSSTVVAVKTESGILTTSNYYKNDYEEE